VELLTAESQNHDPDAAVGADALSAFGELRRYG
jgi:hypothetical protein